MSQIKNDSELSRNVVYSWLIRSSKNEHLDSWGKELGDYTLKCRHLDGLIFDKYFYHELLRYCPDFLNSRYSNLFFYAIDSTNEMRYNKLRKLVVDMELLDSIDLNNYDVLKSIDQQQIDSIQNETVPFLKSIAEHCYLDTKHQVNKEKVTYIRFTYINYMTREQEYELHFYFYDNSSQIADRIVFISKEELRREAERIRELMEIPPPPPPVAPRN